MNNGGITVRIFDFAKALMGWMRGGLGHVNVGASIVFPACPVPQSLTLVGWVPLKSRP